MERFIVAIIKNEKGIKDFYQFDNEEELHYFMACHEDFELVKVEMGGEK